MAGKEPERRVILKKGKATPFLYRHPWVFSGAIADVETDTADGDIVSLCGSGGDFIAWGYYNSRSQIRVRLLSWNRDVLPDDGFIGAMIGRAIRLRRDILRLDSEGDSYRLIHSEGDGIPGLTVDRYGSWLVAQIHSLALLRRTGPVIRALEEVSGIEGILLKNDADICKKEGIDVTWACLRGKEPDGPARIQVRGLRYDVAIQSGQKTGFYLDQRENRTAVSSYCGGKSVLDLCCYTGAFSMHAAKSGAVSVTGVDVSADALSAAESNASLNGIGSIRFVKEEAFKFLEECAPERKYQVIILDPPKFAPSRGGVENALSGYSRLNCLALKAIAPDGVLATCSCSGRVSMEQFTGALLEASKQSGRTVQILETRTQPQDHPVSVFCPETGYLKCLICRVV